MVAWGGHSFTHGHPFWRLRYMVPQLVCRLYIVKVTFVYLHAIFIVCGNVVRKQAYKSVRSVNPSRRNLYCMVLVKQIEIIHSYGTVYYIYRHNLLNAEQPLIFMPLSLLSLMIIQLLNTNTDMQQRMLCALTLDQLMYSGIRMHGQSQSTDC